MSEARRLIWTSTTAVDSSARFDGRTPDTVYFNSLPQQLSGLARRAARLKTPKTCPTARGHLCNGVAAARRWASDSSGRAWLDEPKCPTAKLLDAGFAQREREALMNCDASSDSDRPDSQSTSGRSTTCLRASHRRDSAEAAQHLRLKVLDTWPDIESVLALRLERSNRIVAPALVAPRMGLRSSCEMIGHIGFHSLPGPRYLGQWGPGDAEFGSRSFRRIVVEVLLARRVWR